MHPDKPQEPSDPLLLSHQRFDILNAVHSLSLAWPAAPSRPHLVATFTPSDASLSPKPPGRAAKPHSPLFVGPAE